MPAKCISFILINLILGLAIMGCGQYEDKAPVGKTQVKASDVPAQAGKSDKSEPIDEEANQDKADDRVIVQSKNVVSDTELQSTYDEIDQELDQLMKDLETLEQLEQDPGLLEN